jgi:hypothetical protein
VENCINEIKIELVQNEMECLNHATSGFNIARIINGQIVQIELTCQEVFNAFLVQETRHHTADIEAVLDEWENDTGLFGFTIEEIKSNADLIAAILEEYEDNLDNGMEWRDAVISAVKETLARKGKNEFMAGRNE